jgi:hypothetical protein
LPGHLGRLCGAMLGKADDDIGQCQARGAGGALSIEAVGQQRPAQIKGVAHRLLDTGRKITQRAVQKAAALHHMPSNGDRARDWLALWRDSGYRAHREG